jgi:hypothetical protein
MNSSDSSGEYKLFSLSRLPSGIFVSIPFPVVCAGGYVPAGAGSCTDPPMPKVIAVSIAKEKIPINIIATSADLKRNPKEAFSDKLLKASFVAFLSVIILGFSMFPV